MIHDHGGTRNHCLFDGDEHGKGCHYGRDLIRMQMQQKIDVAEEIEEGCLV